MRSEVKLLNEGYGGLTHVGSICQCGFFFVPVLVCEMLPYRQFLVNLSGKVRVHLPASFLNEILLAKKHFRKSEESMFGAVHVKILSVRGCVAEAHRVQTRCSDARTARLLIIALAQTSSPRLSLVHGFLNASSAGACTDRTIQCQ